MKIKHDETYEVKIYIGSREQYNGKEFTKYNVFKCIGDFQKQNIGRACTVRVTNTSYVFGDYSEAGWEISIINYLRFPKSKDSILKFSLELAEHLLTVFNQNRISVVTISDTYLLEQEDAKENPDETT